jgi:hypothetical protein
MKDEAPLVVREDDDHTLSMVEFESLKVEVE